LSTEQGIFETKAITKKFGGITALNEVSISVHRGKVNVIVGENGAGKSTLMKILSGVYSEYEGQLFMNGEPIHFKTPKEAQAAGIAIIHQELNLIPYLNITENIFLGRELRNRWGFLDYTKMHGQTKALLEKLGLDVSPKTLISELRVGQQQLVEIAKALLEETKVLIMDEPTSALTDKEVEVLFNIIAKLKAEGVSMLYISHKLDELFKIADRFIGLRDGELAGTLEDVSKATKDDLVRLMVGRDIKNPFKKAPVPLGDELLRAENICLFKTHKKRKYLLKDVSFHVHSGEVVGIFGLMGAGRTELLETLFGLHPRLMQGKIFVEGNEVGINSVRDAIDLGIGLVPEDRKHDGLVLNMQVAKNISMANIDKTIKRGLLQNRLEKKLATSFISKLKIKTDSERQKSKNLSGGNQQKVVLSKWLATEPKILFLDEPTRGIDVNAKNEIYHLINELAKQGMAIVVVSSELPEILSVADRILVMGDSRITGTFDQNEATEEAILKAAVL